MNPFENRMNLHFKVLNNINFFSFDLINEIKENNFNNLISYNPINKINIKKFLKNKEINKINFLLKKKLNDKIIINLRINFDNLNNENNFFYKNFFNDLFNYLKEYNFKKIIILFDESWESKSYSYLKKLEEKIIKPLQIKFNFYYFIITSNSMFFDQKKDNILFIPYFYYHYINKNNYYFKKNSSKVFNIFFKYKKTKKTYLFCSLNRIVKTHRLAFLYYLKKINFNNDYLLSFDKINNIYAYSNDFFKNDFIIDLNELLKIKLPIELDIKNFTINQAHHVGPFYMNTFFSQINESLYDSENIFLSEKVFKPIIRLSPFIIFGNPYTLKELERWGFETNFVGINNSYDNEKTPGIRLAMIMNQIKSLDLPKKDLLDFYYQNRDVLIHNYNKYFNLNEKDILEKTDLKKIIDFYESL